MRRLTYDKYGRSYISEVINEIKRQCAEEYDTKIKGDEYGYASEIKLREIYTVDGRKTTLNQYIFAFSK